MSDKKSSMEFTVEEIKKLKASFQSEIVDYYDIDIMDENMEDLEEMFSREVFVTEEVSS